MAIGPKARKPKLDHPPLRIVRFPPPSLNTGVERHLIGGVTVKVTDVPRAVADCFKYRNQVGLDVALEALRDCWRQRRATMDQLHEAAVSRRMANVMRPYLESLT